MNINKYILLFIFTGLLSVKAQVFDIEQTTQLIRPRLKIDSKYTFNTPFSDTTGNFSNFENSAGFTIPLKRTFKTELKLDLSSWKIKDIFKNSVRIKASEILGTFKITQRQTKLGFDSVPTKNFYYLNAGIIGLYLTKKYRILFYSANINIHEESNSIKTTVPRFSGLIGQYHIRGLRKSFYYGATLVYSDKLLIPAPFIGGTEPISKTLSINYTLPVMINLQYHQKKIFLIAGVKADGYRTGIFFKEIRTNLNYTNASAYFNFRYRASNTLHLQAEAGYLFFHRIQMDRTDKFPYKYPINNAVYGNISIHVYFGKSMLEKIIDQVF